MESDRRKSYGNYSTVEFQEQIKKQVQQEMEKYEIMIQLKEIINKMESKIEAKNESQLLMNFQEKVTSVMNMVKSLFYSVLYILVLSYLMKFSTFLNK